MRVGTRRVVVVVAAALAGAVALVSMPATAQRLGDEEYRQQMDLLRSPEPTARIDAAELLGRRGYSRRREIAVVLRELLRADPDWRVRASSGRALGRLGTRDAVPDLVRALRDPQVEVRVVAAAALWRLPDPAAVPALLEVLSDSDAAARQWAALALGVIRDQRATQPLVRLMNEDPIAAVRLDVLRSLGRIGDATALTPLRDFARSAQKPVDERIEAIDALAALGSPDKVNALAQMVDDPERRVRMRVVRALGEVGDALVIPTLRRRRGQERDPQIRTAIDEAQAAIRARMAAAAPTPPTGAAPSARTP
jgi:HEAT repeat protein